MQATNTSLRRWQLAATFSSSCCIVLLILYLLGPPVQPVWKAVSADKSFIVSKLNSKPLEYQQLYRTVYKPRRYTVCSKRNSSADTGWLYLRKNVNCKDLFKAVLLADDERPDQPPQTMPAADWKDFLLDGNIELVYQYVSKDVYNGNPVPLDWTKEYVDGFIERVGVRREGGNYGIWQHAVYNALDTASLTGLHGLVVGSETPWVEAAILHRGAASVTTSEYRKIIATHPKTYAYHPAEIARRFLDGNIVEYDFAVSYSSIEHSGLGRYGDPINAQGDLREVEKVSCLVKPGGLLFLGLPLNVDRVVWNVHRFYGPIRLPLVTANWEVLDVVSRDPQNYTNSDLSPYWAKSTLDWEQQPVVVLKNKRVNPCK